MKSIRFFSLLTFIIIFIFPCLTIAQPVLFVATEWPPYEMMDKDKPSGLATDIIIGVMKKMNTDYEIQFYPWVRAENMAKSGEADALFSISKKKEREEFLIYTQIPLHQSTYVFFIRKADKNRLKYNSLDDLKGYQIGVTRGYTYSSDLMKFIEDQKNFDDGAKNDTENFKKLEKNRFDYFPCDLANGMAILKNTGFYEQITYIEKPIIEKDYYVAFSKFSRRPDIKKITQNFDNNLKAFKETPEYKGIIDKYLK